MAHIYGGYIYFSREHIFFAYSLWFIKVKAKPSSRRRCYSPRPKKITGKTQYLSIDDIPITILRVSLCPCPIQSISCICYWCYSGCHYNPYNTL